MGANQLQIQATLGQEMAAIQNLTLDLEQRQRSFAVREQERRRTFQMRNPGR